MEKRIFFFEWETRSIVSHLEGKVLLIVSQALKNQLELFGLGRSWTHIYFKRRTKEFNVFSFYFERMVQAFEAKSSETFT